MESTGAREHKNASQEFSELCLGFLFMLAIRKKMNRSFKFKKNINDMEVIETVVTVMRVPPTYAFTTH